MTKNGNGGILGIGRRNLMKAVGLAGIAGAFSTTASAKTTQTAQTAVDRSLPATNFSVELEVEGTTLSGFKSIELPSISTVESEYREGDRPDSQSQQLWGRTEYGDLTLERAVRREEPVLYDWHNQIRLGNFDESRKQIDVNILDSLGVAGAKFKFYKAWPKEYSPPSLDATATGEDAMAIESVTLAYDWYERAV